MGGRGGWEITEKLLLIIVLPTGEVPRAHSRKNTHAELVTMCRTVVKFIHLFKAYSKYVYDAITSMHIDITELDSLVLTRV